LVLFPLQGFVEDVHTEAMIMKSDWESRGCLRGGLVAGIVLLSLGLLFLLANLGILDSRLMHTWWPLLLIVLGLAKLLRSRGVELDVRK
jgi:hypothetical protein